MLSHEVLIRPVVTEKNTMLGDQNKYVFEVHRDANKIEIGRAVAEVFNVQVKSVNVLKVPGKQRVWKRQRGHTRSWKKAIVTLQPGSRIELFQGV
jgi:large subunit ribosomal protein L23